MLGSICFYIKNCFFALIRDITTFMIFNGIIIFWGTNVPENIKNTASQKNSCMACHRKF